MPYSVGEYVSVKAAGWHGQIMRTFGGDRYRVRVGGTGGSKKNIGFAEEPGMIGRLRGSEDYAVDNYDGKDALYTPERDNPNWTYDALPALFPLGEDYDEDEVEDDDLDEDD